MLTALMQELDFGAKNEIEEDVEIESTQGSDLESEEVKSKQYPYRYSVKINE